MDQPDRGSSARVIAGVLFGAVLGIAFISACLFFCWKRLKYRFFSERVVQSCARSRGLVASMFIHESEQPLHPLAIARSALPQWWRSMDDSSTASADRVVRFTYKELQRATKGFSMLIGRGAFGPVYKATLPNKSVVAVKVLATHSKQGEKEFQSEIILLGRLHHRNLLNLVGYCAEGGHRLLTFDFMSNGSLATRLHDEHSEPLSWEQRVSIAQDVARGIEYLHDGAVPPVIHRDIKASNILLDSFMIARVADFGLSKEADPNVPASGIKGTYGYVDPEYVSSNSLTHKSDVYSFGVVLFEMIAARSPEGGLMEYVELILMTTGGREAFLQILDPRLKGNCNLKELCDIALIATKCIETKARNRPRMQEVVQALSRFGRVGSTKLEILSLPSVKKYEKKERPEVSMITRLSSMVEARG